MIHESLSLGNHYHNYNELFFTPTGGFKFALSDLDDPDKQVSVYELNRGSRILIPEYVAHRVIGKENAVLQGFGSVEFDPKGLIPCESNLVEILKRELEKYL